MNQKLHRNARTTPAVRLEIAASTESAPVLAARYGVTPQTILKWKARGRAAQDPGNVAAFVDKSHTADHLQTTMTPQQEAIVVYLRRKFLVPLDDLVAVTKEFICADASRSGVDRCLRRHGLGNLRAMRPAPAAEPVKTFKAYDPGYAHIDIKYLPQMADETRRSDLFVAIDRETRWVHVSMKGTKTAAHARAFLAELARKIPFKIKKILTDNGKEFTDRLFASREREASGQHEFDRLCAELGIEHRLTKPRTPRISRTKGMVERFNGRIADILRTHHFRSGESLRGTLLRYVALYNHQFPQAALSHRTPVQAMKDGYRSRPELFNKRPYDRMGCDS